MKSPKLFTAYNGDAAGLRKVLIDHLDHQASHFKSNGGTTWNDGVDAGRGLAYREMISFLKKLVVNQDDTESTDA